MGKKKNCQKTPENRLCRMLLYEIKIHLQTIDNKRDIGGGGGSRTFHPHLESVTY